MGYEKVLIKRRMATAEPTNRFVPVLRSGDGSAVPAFLGTRLYADMRNESGFDDVLDELAALFYGQQLLRAPTVQPPPAWLRALLDDAGAS